MRGLVGSRVKLGIL
ncbi:hypothetical protein LINPERPRIM_LOCUS6432 [Linum perenne]